MGLFHKKTDDGVDLEQEERFLDETFREELRNHGRWYFEKIISENGTLFKRDLDATVAQLNEELKNHVTQRVDQAVAQMNTELKEHVTQQLQQQFTAFTETMKRAQDNTLQSLTQSAETLQQQYQQLGQELRSTVSEQESLLHNAFEDSKAHISGMSDAQDEAIRTLKASVQALQEQHQQLSTTLKKDVEDQKTILLTQFESHLADTVEWYLLDAIGEQYDLKAQVPAIIKQLEANKQAIVDDVKL